ncbi:hypothetical protein CYY_001159 [Polysphondylium violaceum]|uniref:O-methyltransferase domain-containing protein n=1 Tax=Polysphondylium violaceum TaxID=133409 RepID=A0A8J4Q0K1_9MYCE|nr:hypothetical protein CYY_001159 [Polysphondylium violaceum]
MISKDCRIENENSLFDLATGHWKSRALAFIVENKIANYLIGGPKSAFVIADEIKVNGDFLYRLMRALTTLDIFIEEKEFGVFSQTPKSQILCEDQGFMDNLTFELHDFSYLAFSNLRETIKEGKTLGPNAIGCDSVWEAIKQPSYTTLFQKAMTSYTKSSIEIILSNTNFSKFNTIVDLGGSQGVFCLEILKNNPSIGKAINFDIPLTIQSNKSLLKSRLKSYESELSRFEEIQGSFFDANTIPEADCYILKLVLHDWSDDQAVEILKAISKSMKPTSKIYIFDTILERNNEMFNRYSWMDLQMVHYVGGKERSIREWSLLSKLADFNINSIQTLPGVFRCTKGDFRNTKSLSCMWRVKSSQVLIQQIPTFSNNEGVNFLLNNIFKIKGWDVEKEKTLLLDLATGHWKSRALGFIVEYNISSFLIDGPKSAYEIADEIKVNGDFLYRLMRALSTEEIFKEESEGKFSQTPKSQILYKDEGFRDFLIYQLSDFAYSACSNLKDSIKEGKTLGPKAIGCNSFWDVVQTPSRMPLFQKAMTSYTKSSIVIILSNTNFSKFNTIVDLGGSQGIFSLEILKNNPSIGKAINFDIPLTIQSNKSLLESRLKSYESELSRFEEIQGSFFDANTIPEADCYIGMMNKLLKY